MDVNPAYRMTGVRREIEAILILMESGKKDVKIPKEVVQAYKRLLKLSDKLVIDVWKENGGTKCPFCDSTGLDKNHELMDGLYPVREIKCRNCRKKWAEHFELNQVTEVTLKDSLDKNKLSKGELKCVQTKIALPKRECILLQQKDVSGGTALFMYLVKVLF